MSNSKNRYNELSNIHRFAVDQLVNSIASHQCSEYMDKQISIATYDAIKNIGNSYIQKAYSE